MRLLIAEDGLDLAEALTVFFEKNQFSVDTVHDGFAAYDYVYELKDKSLHKLRDRQY